MIHSRRKKSTPRKIPNEDEPTTPKRSRIAKTKRILTSIPTKDATVLAVWKIPWPDSEPKSLRFVENNGTWDVFAGDSILPINSNFAEALMSPEVLLIGSDVLDSERTILIAAKWLPFRKARPLVESLFQKDYSSFDAECIVDTSAWRQFFKELELIQISRQLPPDDFQQDGLVPTLRGYQRAAVGWMIEREQKSFSLDLSWLGEVTDNIPIKNGENLLYSKYSGALYPPILPTPISSGGILADEMGLGKTVVTLALVLNNKCTEASGWESCIRPDKVMDFEEDSSDEDTNLRELNQEDALNADEELQTVKNKLAKGMLRSKLNAWYESKLAEMSVNKTSPKKHRRRFKCVCGGDPEKKARRHERIQIACESCGLFQHKQCCGFVPGMQYICPDCWREQPLVPSKATLVIVPPAIFSQWEVEIKKHTPELKVAQYDGVKVNFVQPLKLAEYDVVITTYPILRAESMYTAEPSERSMRSEGRFLRTTSPLEKISWWRIVCDEAQMVESDFSLVRQMTQRLSATHRWCVTGTPIQKNIADLYYLTSFMGLGVFDDKNTWTDLLLKPYFAGCKKPLLSVVQQIFWRSTKEQVMDELGIPDQSFQSHFLKFSAIEETFYKQEHLKSASDFAAGLRKSGLDLDRTIASVDKSTLNRLLLPLLNIRQACTHPQVVHGIKITSASGAANLAELLQYLIRKTKQECEEALRKHVAALNGLAGLSCLEERWTDAISCYREVFRLSEENKDDKIQVDTLQRIHALWNAAEILETCPSLPPTLRDANLRENATELEQKYLTKAEDVFKSARAQANAISKEVSSTLKEFESSPGAWWLPVILSCTDLECDLVAKLEEELHSNDRLYESSAKRFLARVSSISRIQMVLKAWWESVEKYHKKVTKSIDSLMDFPCSLLVEEALGCHLRVDNEKRTCEMCKAEQIMQDFECELFNTTKKIIKEREKVLDGAVTKGSWQASYAERTLLIVLNFARARSLPLNSWCLEDGRRHIRLLEAMKKEFKLKRAAWTALMERVQAEDEVTMAKIRLRIAQPWETKKRPSILALSQPNKNDTIHLVPSHEIPIMINELTSDRDSSYSTFKRQQGKLLYLQNLSKDRNATPDPCPVCRSAIEQQWCVLSCGHCFCIDCLQKFHGATACRVKCPVCRELTESSEIGFVDTTGSNPICDISVTGDFSTKVDSIVREVLRLVSQEPEVKILVFSTWTEVLKILHHAFTENKVKILSLPAGKHQEIIRKFRDQKSGVTVLLLPLAWGSKGLNLIEATHVFLVEPILNPSEELQAIGRVHRIGQTRPTFVHRFIIRSTVEEKIFAVVSEAKDTWTNKKVTLSDLKKLFVIPQRQNCLS